MPTAHEQGIAHYRHTNNSISSV